jgi:predicted nucleic acid-binding protein
MGDRVVLDANVIVGWLDATDSLHARAKTLTLQLKAADASIVLVDFVVSEAVSVFARRARERKAPQRLPTLPATTRSWAHQILALPGAASRLWHEVHDLIEGSSGRLNFNDGLLVALQAEGSIGTVATFDANLRDFPDFKHI